jgi:hypothetical protein
MANVSLVPEAKPEGQNGPDPERERLIDAAVRRACAKWYDGDLTKLRKITRHGITALSKHPMFIRVVCSEFAGLIGSRNS